MQRGLLDVVKVSGVTNVADALTKFHDLQKLRSLCKPHGVMNGPDVASFEGRAGVCGECPENFCRVKRQHTYGLSSAISDQAFMLSLALEKSVTW